MVASLSPQVRDLRHTILLLTSRLEHERPGRVTYIWALRRRGQSLSDLTRHALLLRKRFENKKKGSSQYHYSCRQGSSRGPASGAALSGTRTTVLSSYHLTLQHPRLRALHRRLEYY